MHNKLFPVCVVDDFYHNPHDVREFALSQKFYPNDDGRWPGARTKPIDAINENLFNHFCEKILGLFYSSEGEIADYVVQTYFQKIKPFHPEKTHKSNRGFIHQDGVLFGGVVYLDLYPEEGTGTSIYTPKTKWWYADSLSLNVNNIKHRKYKDGILTDEDVSNWDQHRDTFYESIRVENRFNRCILFDGNEHHGVPSFGTQERLTQVFFVERIIFGHDARNPKYPLVNSSYG
jgi:hypothetical protein